MKSIFLVCLALVFVDRGDCQLNCHQCNSIGGLDCLDKYNGPEMEGDYSDACGDTDTHCSKFKIISKLYDSGFILGKPRETDTVTRGCIRATGESDGCKYIASASGFMFLCICSTDNCNGAGLQVASFVTLVTSLLLTTLLRRIIS